MEAIAMPNDILMITLAGTGAWFATIALIADLLGMTTTCALAAGLAAWTWISAGNLAFGPHERPAIAMQTEPTAKWILRVRPEAAMPAGKKLFGMYYERNTP
jgi:hypothetical protein